MKSVFKTILTCALVVMIALTAVGCSSTTDTDVQSGQQANNTPTLPTNMAPRPSHVLQPADDDCVLIGEWNVTSQSFGVDKITFNKDGSLIMELPNGALLGGDFTYTDAKVAITSGNVTTTGNYVMENGVITITTQTDVLTLTNPKATTDATTETTLADVTTETTVAP